MTVRRWAVRVVVGCRPEAHDGVEQRRRDDREDDDADDRHEPEDRIDAVGLLRRRRRQPRKEDGDRRGDPAGEHADAHEGEDLAPPHGREPSRTRNSEAAFSVAPPNPLETTRETQTWVLE